MTIVFKNLSKIYNGKIIFENISGKINDGEKVGIVGVNGVGKTTLMKVIMKSEDKDFGEITYIPQNIRFGYLNQYASFDDTSVYDELLKSIPASNSLIYDADSCKSRVKKILLEAGFNEIDFNKPASKLSGGEKTKLSICKTLMKDSDILVLDEPTNHLDMESIKKLEDILKNIKKTVIIISHDRQFLDNTVEKILEMNSNCLNEYRGNYSAYRLQKENLLKAQRKEYEKQQNEIKHLKEIIENRKTWFESAHKSAGQNDFYRSKSKKHVSIMKSKEKQLKKLEDNKIEKPKPNMVGAYEYLMDTSERKLPQYIIRGGNISKAFGENSIFQDVSYDIKRGEKIALLGKNASGKSTFIKMILGKEKLDSGYININPSIKIAYFSQELTNLDFNNTVLDELLKENIPIQHARLILGSLLFREDDVFKKINDLSMGERCRVAFAKIIISSANMLILDEPTNYMDIISRERIEEILKDYNGSVLLVSHDRYFVKKIANRIFEIEGSKLNIYEGNFEYYLSQKEETVKKEKLGNNYINIKDEIRRLECEIAFISGKLGDPKLVPNEKAELDKKFIHISRMLTEYKSIIN